MQLIRRWARQRREPQSQEATHSDATWSLEPRSPLSLNRQPGSPKARALRPSPSPLASEEEEMFAPQLPKALGAQIPDGPVAVCACIGERSSGKSGLLNLLAREPLFALGAGSSGVVLGSKSLSAQALAEASGCCPPTTAMSLVLCEFGASLRLDQLSPLLKVAKVVVYNTVLGSAHDVLLALGFVPLWAQLMQEQRLAPRSDLVVVVRQDLSDQDAQGFRRSLWQEEIVDGQTMTPQEYRNCVRFHLPKVFRSVRVHFLPPQDPPSSAFLEQASIVTTDVLSRCFQVADGEAILSGRSVAYLLGRSRALLGAALTEDVATGAEHLELLDEDKLSRYERQALDAVREAEAERLFVLAERQVEALVLPKRKQPLPEPQIRREVQQVVQQCQMELREQLHQHTPHEVRDAVLARLQDAVSDRLEQEWVASNARLLAELVQHLSDEWVLDLSLRLQGVQTPKGLGPFQQELEQLVQERLEWLLKSEAASPLDATGKHELLGLTRQKLGPALQQKTAQNEAQVGQLCAREVSRILREADEHFHRLACRCREAPFTGRELQQVLEAWIQDALSRGKAQLADYSECVQIGQLHQQLQTLSHDVVAQNMAAANAKVSEEIVEALRGVREDVLRPQVAACIAAVGAEMKAVAELAIQVVASGDKSAEDMTALRRSVARLDFPDYFHGFTRELLEYAFAGTLQERKCFLLSASEMVSRETIGQAITRAVGSGWHIADRKGVVSFDSFSVLSEEVRAMIRQALGTIAVEETEDLARRQQMRDAKFRELKQLVQRDETKPIRPARPERQTGVAEVELAKLRAIAMTQQREVVRQQRQLWELREELAGAHGKQHAQITEVVQEADQKAKALVDQKPECPWSDEVNALLVQGKARIHEEMEQLVAFERQLPPELVRGLERMVEQDDEVRLRLGLPRKKEPLTAREEAAVRPGEWKPRRKTVAKRKDRGPECVCRTCRQRFYLNENTPVACHFHKGWWVVAPNRGRARAIANAARLLVGGADKNRYLPDMEKHENEDVGKWSCCGRRDKADEGCVIQCHIPVD